MSGELLLEAKGVTRRVERGGPVLVESATLAVHAGERIVVTGPSGAGKSVLLRALALLDPLAGGEVRWRGTPVRGADVPAFRCRVAYVAQRPAMFDGSVEDNLRLPYTLRHHAGQRFDAAAAERWLSLAGRPAGFLSKRARDLSGGEAQVTALVRVLQTAPSVLLLDEPTSALDVDTTARIEALIGEWAATHDGPAASVWITHSPEQAARVGTRFVTMSAGRLGAAAAAPSGRLAA